MSGYIGPVPTPQATQSRDYLTATAGQTSFPTAGYTPGYLDVYLNGVHLQDSDFTATNGSDVVLNDPCAADDVVLVVAWSTFEAMNVDYSNVQNAPTNVSDFTNDAGYASTAYVDTAESDAVATANAYTDTEIGNISVTPAGVSDQNNTSTGFFALPTGTTAQRPGGPASGYSRFNSDTGSIEFYDGATWIATNLIPTINSVTGTIYAGAASTITLNITNATDTVTVRFSEGGATAANVNDVTVTSGSASVAVPAAVYGQSGGDTIAVSILNQDGTPSSNSISKTVVGLPTGGTISTVSSYRVHTFTSSSSLVVPSNFSATAEYLLVAGGGSGGVHNAGGGGAGGMLTGSTGISTNTYTITIGAGGAARTSDSQAGLNGANTTALGLTAIGGGGGSSANAGIGPASGGSGGGGWDGKPVGAGTSGQGNPGGRANSTQDLGGGGGAGAPGQDGSDGNYGGDGGAGLQSNIDGNNYYYAGGGGGAAYQAGDPSGDGGIGGGGGGGGGSDSPGGAGGGSARNSGGNGGSSSPSANGGESGGSGGANTGGGGGGKSRPPGGASGAGGSGIVIIRYQL